MKYVTKSLESKKNSFWAIYDLDDLSRKKDVVNITQTITLFKPINIVNRCYEACYNTILEYFRMLLYSGEPNIQYSKKRKKIENKLFRTNSSLFHRLIITIKSICSFGMIDRLYNALHREMYWKLGEDFINVQSPPKV